MNRPWGRSANRQVARVIAEMRRAARRARDRLAPAPEVIERDRSPAGDVVTVRYADTRSPSGSRFQTTASWPDGTVAERKWTTYEIDARAAHQAAVARHRRRTLPDE